MKIENGPYNLALDKHQYIIMNNQEYQNNTIDLLKLISDLYNKRWFILSLTALFTLLAIGRAFILTPKYEVKTVLTQPNADQIQVLHLNTDSKLTGSDIFKKYVKTLSSKGNYISFLEQSGALDKSMTNFQTSSDYDRKKQLNKLLLNYNVAIIYHTKLDPKDAYNDNSLEAELITRSSKLDLDASENLAYIEYTNQKVLADVAKIKQSITHRKIEQLKKIMNQNESKVSLERHNEIKRLINQQSLSIDELNNKIDALNKRDLRDRELRLQELTNALKIAESLGITSYDTPQQVNNHGLIIDVNQNTKDLYLRGTKYLKNEIAIIKEKKHTLNYEKQLSELQEQLYIAQNDKKIIALNNRTDDKPYIKGIEEKQTQLSHLQSLSFNIANIKLYKIEGAPIVETSPIKPNKKLIIMLGFILGFIFSTSYIMMQNVIGARKGLE